jgi:hypothetical protein
MLPSIMNAGRHAGGGGTISRGGALKLKGYRIVHGLSSDAVYYTRNAFWLVWESLCLYQGG